jgi:cytochrome P450
MQTLAELDLPHLPIEDPAFGENPMPYFAEARAKHPWLAKSNFGLVVHEFTAIRELYWMDDKMRPNFDHIVDLMEAHGTPWGRFTEEQMIALPDREHKLLRTAFAARFTPKNANDLRPVMRKTIGRLLDEWAPKGGFDFEEFSSWFPISVMFSLVGAPLEEIGPIKSDLETLGLAFSLDKTRVPALQQSIQRLDDLVQVLIAQRRANPSPEGAQDLLDILIEAGDSGGINPRQLADAIMFFFIAGYDTSKNVLTYLMYLMIQHPDIYARCASDYDYCRKAVEEGLRVFNPSSSFRATSEDIVFRDVLLPKNTQLFFTLNISGHDPDVFERPDIFDPERKLEASQRHVAFGLGKHMCLGQYIARAQLQEALHQTAQRLHEPRIAGAIGWRPFQGIWGIKGLPITFTPAQEA